MTCDEVRSTIIDQMGQEVECLDLGADHFSLTLPLLKPNGDAIEVSVQSRNNDAWRISDFGETYSTLFLSGVDLYEEYARAEEFRQIKALHKLSEHQQELFIDVAPSDFGLAALDFAQAIQSILSLQLTVVRRAPKRDFNSQVTKLLSELRASFEVPAEYIDGKTGRWRFDFVLNTVRKETLIRTLTSASRSNALHASEQAVFEILDVKEVRDSNAVVIADDEGSREAYWQPHILRIFEGYQIPMLQFKKNREDLVQLALSFAR